jgi:hypothetical protein
MTTILQQRIVYHSTRLDEQQLYAALHTNEALGPLRDLMARMGEMGMVGDLQATALLRQYLEQQATVLAYQDCFVLMAMLCLVGMPLVLFLRRQGS